MLFDAKLRESFWVKAMRTVVDLINLSPSAPLDSDVPERVWTGKDISYKHLRVFSCKAYVYIPKDERSNLDLKSKEYIFLGYRFRYRLWDLVTRKLIKSRDVVFLKDQIIGDVEKSDESQSSPEILIIQISISPPVVHDDHEGANEDNNDGLVEPVDQTPQNNQHYQWSQN